MGGNNKSEADGIGWGNSGRRRKQRGPRPREKERAGSGGAAGGDRRVNDELSNKKEWASAVIPLSKLQVKRCRSFLCVVSIVRVRKQGREVPGKGDERRKTSMGE